MRAALGLHISWVMHNPTPLLLPRSELLHRLRALPLVPLTVLNATAGFGKTTLLGHWAHLTTRRNDGGIAELSRSWSIRWPDEACVLQQQRLRVAA